MQCRMPKAAMILFRYGTRPLLDNGHGENKNYEANFRS
jgi:hypothetical protein